MSERVTQADWDAARAERKAVAAVTVAENAEAAKAAKDAARAKGPGLGNEEFLARAKRIESIHNAAHAQVAELASDSEVGYEDLSKDELSELLKERDLPHSGTKAELIARLEEADNTPVEETA